MRASKEPSEPIPKANPVLERDADRAASQVPRTSDVETAAPRGTPAPRTVSADVPAAAREGVESPGRPLDADTRAEMESSLGHDFGNVRVHTDDRAAASAESMHAKAFTAGDHVVFGHGRFAPNAPEGKELLAHELAHVAQQDHTQVPAIQRAPLDEIASEEAASEELATEEVAEVSVADQTDAELVTSIFGTQLAILTGWETALDNFDKVLTSSSAKSANPDFRKVFMTFFQDKLMGEMISRSGVTGAGDAFALLGKLEAEVQRASAARDSLSLRDFFVAHNTAIGSLRQTVESTEGKFQTQVRLTTENAEQGSNASGVQRIVLENLLERLEFRLLLSSPQDLFKDLSEEWINQQQLTGALGIRTPALILIDVNHDFTIRNAEIKGTGGQKIAEQLLIDSPEGVDVFGMAVPRRVFYFKAGQRVHDAIVKLDANGRDINEGSPWEGNYLPIAKVLKRSGLPPTKKLSGD